MPAYKSIVMDWCLEQKAKIEQSIYFIENNTIRPRFFGKSTDDIIAEYRDQIAQLDLVITKQNTVQLALA